MKLKALALGLVLAVVAAMPASAQRGGNQSDWELLGREKIGVGGDKDSIVINQTEDFYRDKAYKRLRFVVEGGNATVRSVRLIYINGATEDLNFSGKLRAGQQVDVDLRGERSYLRQIDFDYSAKFGFSFGGGGIRLKQAYMNVFGENIRRGRPPAPPVTFVPPPSAGGRSWNSIGDARFDRRDSRVEIAVGRREGRFGQLRLRHSGEPVNVLAMRIRFGNGEVQNVNVSQRLEDGQQTRPIDVEGDRRFVERVVVELEPRNRPGRVSLVLEGTERPGRDGGEPPRGRGGNRTDWVPLGRQTVGFGVDRDVIRVGQSEDFFRNRGFDKLHFTAENNEIYMNAIRVVYINGTVEDYRIGALIPAGGDLAVDLPGSRSYIREIEMSYRARQGFRGQAIMNVFGEPSRR